MSKDCRSTILIDPSAERSAFSYCHLILRTCAYMCVQTHNADRLVLLALQPLQAVWILQAAAWTAACPAATAAAEDQGLALAYRELLIATWHAPADDHTSQQTHIDPTTCGPLKGSATGSNALHGGVASIGNQNGVLTCGT